MNIEWSCLGKRWAHFISDFVGAGPNVIVFSIVVVGCFGLVFACLILLGHVICCFLQHGHFSGRCKIATQTIGGRLRLDLLFLEYDAFQIHWRFCFAVFVVVLCFDFFVSVVVCHIAV